MRTLWLLFFSLSGVCDAFAADLGKLDRTIKKEPVYQSKVPRYGLLVLGSNAEARVWLVFDSVPDPLTPGKAHDYLYVDRNGNADFDEKGERFEAVVRQRRVTVSFSPGFYDEPLLEFNVGDIKGPDGTVHKEVRVVVEWYRGKERPAIVSATSGGRTQDSGAVVFSATAKAAPVIHIGGRLTFGLKDAQDLSLKRGRENELYIFLGTPGLGEETFATLGVESVPERSHPVAEVEFPPPAEGKVGRTLTVVLNRRC